MHEETPSRRSFLLSTAALTALGAAPPLVPDSLDPDHPGRLAHALALSGGGARGAYQAGIVDYLRLARGVRDGEMLAPYGIIAGTSIGALNGYFIATGQFTMLRTLWYSVADQDVIRLKPRYAKLVNTDSGVGNRLTAAMRMILGLASSDTGVIDGDHLRAWMARSIDPARPVITPFVWTATNLSTQAPEFFFLVNSEISPAERAAAVAAIKVTVGADAVLREATPEILIDALRASTAIPVAFDPVELPAPSGDGTNLYVDGGVTANTPIGIARAAAAAVDVIFLDPPLQETHYRNALDIGFGVFGAMQRRILEADLRSTYLETFGKRTLQALRKNVPAAAAANLDVADLRAFATALFAADIYTMRPTHELPVNVVGFDDRENVYKTYKIGFEDARNGFIPYRFGSD